MKNIASLSLPKGWNVDELRNKPKRQVLLALIVFGAVLAAIGAVKFIQIQMAISAQAAQTPPPEAVTSLAVELANWSDSLELMGSLSPTQGVTVSAEEPGKVTKVQFESGAKVAAGDLLVEIDSSVEQAQLQGAIAATARTLAAYERAQRLIKQKAISDDVFDSAREGYQQATAQEQSLRAVIAKKNVSAPFSGTLGIRMVNVGQYVTAGTALVPLHSLDPIYLDFSIPQSSIARVAVGQRVVFSVDAFPGRRFEGEISVLNPQVDASTRNVAVRASVPNNDGALRPGMFVSLQLAFPTDEQRIVIPQSAVMFAPYGDTVYVIEPAAAGTATGTPRAVRQQVVQLGKKRGDQVVVLAGLNPGEEVVTSGVFKLRPGATVLVDNSIAPSNLPNPKPIDS